jgi:hypothetical protein
MRRKIKQLLTFLALYFWWKDNLVGVGFSFLVLVGNQNWVAAQFSFLVFVV